jgi:hypothetical protein
MSQYKIPAVVCILMFASPSLAAGVPAQLWGKTISVSFTASSPTTGARGPTVGSRNVELHIYVSSAGRIFERAAAVARTGAGAKDYAPEGSGWRFAGQKMVKSTRSISGASLLQISFDAGFGSCTFSGIIGHESGKAFKWKGLNGTEYEATGPSTISAERCSIAAGNGL